MIQNLPGVGAGVVVVEVVLLVVAEDKTCTVAMVIAKILHHTKERVLWVLLRSRPNICE